MSEMMSDRGAEPTNESARMNENVERGLAPGGSVSRVRWLLDRLISFYGITLAIGVGATAVFGWLADEVLEAEFAGFNRAVLLAIHRHATPTLDQLALAASWLGSGLGLVLLTVALAVLFVRARKVVDAWILVVAIIGGWLLSATLKLAFHQERPRLFPHLESAANFSFPSGHSLASFVYWGFLATWLILQEPRQLWRWIVGLVCLGVASAVAVSRLYIGVHWPTDVVAGMLVAVVWLSWLFAGRQWLAHRIARRAGAERGA